MQITIKADQPQAILIGHEGEYAVESVLFDVSAWAAEYGEGTLTLIYERPGGDPQRYPVVLSDNAWTIGTADTAYEGRGAAQLTYELANGRKKSCIFDVYVAKSFESTPAPDPYETWMDALQAMAALTQANAQRAEASAESAGTSETNAATSEANAAASATAAAASETNAAGSATSAAESAGSASNSASAAASSETNAAGSASAAALSETNAATSATQAAASATAASNSATSAAGSATSAGNSASAASGSASAAAGSAASASESATSAAGSASSASGSATASAASATAAYSSALDSEAWAVGQKAGVDVPATDARYHNNSKFYAQQAWDSSASAAGSATSAYNSATSADTSATNAAASAQSAQDVLDSIPEDYTELSEDVSELTNDLRNLEGYEEIVATTTSISAYINIDTGVISNSSNNRTYWLQCEPNKTYVVEKMLSNYFRIGFTENQPVAREPVFGIVYDNEATSLRATSPANGNFMVIHGWNKIDGDAGITNGEIKASVHIYEITAKDDQARSDIQDIKTDLANDYIYKFPSEEDMPIDICHRGLCENGIPENTMYSFARCKANNWKWVETDIRKTSDGVFVLLHDATINRTARNADGSAIAETVSISGITYAQALGYDFGIYAGEQYAGTKIPTLDEFIDYCDKAYLIPVLEIKDSQISDTDAAGIWEILEKYNMQFKVAFLCSSVGGVQWFLSKNPYCPAFCTASSNWTYIDPSDFDTTLSYALNYKTGKNKVFYDRELSGIGEYADNFVDYCHYHGIYAGVYCPTNKATIESMSPRFDAVTSQYYKYSEVQGNYSSSSSGGGITDVQVNGTSVVTDGVANVPIASTNAMGVAQIPTSGGLYISSTGALSTNRALENEIKAGTSDYKPIVPKRQHASIFYGLATAAGDTTQSASSNTVGTYTDEAKAMIQQMLGIAGLIAPVETGTASQAYSVGQCFLYNGKLCRATASISVSDAIVIGTNCEQTTIMEEITR